MGCKTEGLEGIGPASAGKPDAAGMRTTDHLLQHCSDPADRRAVAINTGRSVSQLLKRATLAAGMAEVNATRKLARTVHGEGVINIRIEQVGIPSPLISH